MELAEGSLRDCRAECSRAGGSDIPGELLTCLSGAAAALDYLHAHGLLHQDVKPDSIMLVKGRAKVSGLDCARLPIQTLVGTPAYMAPEMFLRASDAAPASDQYSLAVSYVEMRIGRRPFGGKDLRGLMRAHVEDSPDLGKLPAPEQKVLRHALAKDPDEGTETADNSFGRCSASPVPNCVQGFDYC